MSNQASKKKRKQRVQFRVQNFSDICRGCGNKVKKSSVHHFYCNECHREKEARKKKKRI